MKIAFVLAAAVLTPVVPLVACSRAARPQTVAQHEILPAPVPFQGLGPIGADGVVGYGSNGAFSYLPDRGWTRLQIAEKEFPAYVPVGSGGILVVQETTRRSDGWAAENAIVALTSSGMLGRRRPLPSPIYGATSGTTSAALLLDNEVLFAGLDLSLVPGPKTRRREIHILFAGEGNVVLCRKNAGRPVNDLIGDDKGGAGCRSSKGWAFDGHWFDRMPIACGAWMLEPVERIEGGAGGGALKVRLLSSGEVIRERGLGVGDVFCLDEKRIWDTATFGIVSLPDLDHVGTARCSGGSALGVMRYGLGFICLDGQGHLADLVMESVRM